MPEPGRETACCGTADHCYFDGSMRECHPEQAAADERDRQTTVEDGFCPSCEVTLDLHSTTDGEDEVDCRIAGQKADLLTRFGGLFGGR